MNIPTPLQTADQRYWYSAKVIRVVDGDTLQIAVDLGCETWRNLTVRLAGVDAPERGTLEGKAATQYTVAWVANHPGALLINTVRDRKEKYGRYLAWVFGPSSSGRAFACLNADLVTSGHAVEYGQKKAAEEWPVGEVQG